MKNVSCFLCFLVMVFIQLQAQNNDIDLSKAPDLKTFSNSPDLLGVLGNSINLFTGQINLPLTIASLSTSSGLSSNVSIFYSSAGINQQARTWNLETPTGILGLGWSFNYPKIVRDHKQTGAREDDDFYLVEGGSSNHLICTAINNLGILSLETREYKSKNYTYWIIKWYASTDSWEIIKEDGARYVYGKSENAKQFCIKWGNWIGDSKNTEGNPRSHTIVWNLEEVSNQAVPKVKFTYEKVEQVLVANTAVQTEACYLKSISETYGNSIVLNYGDKDPLEYMEPNTNAIEPDAYQEQYEKRFLNSINIIRNTTNETRSIRFEYELVSVLSQTKDRLLKGIVEMAVNDVIGRVSFEYDPDLGYILKQITLPSGGSIFYDFELKSIGHSNRSLSIQAPVAEPGYQYFEPQVGIASDYVVVVWRRGASNGVHLADVQPIKIQVYQWLGEWVQKDIQPTNGLTACLSNSSKSYVNYALETQENYFALLTHVNAQGSHVLLLCSKDDKQRGEWTVVENLVSNQNGSTESAFSMRTAKDFVLLIDQYKSNSPWQFYTHTYTKNLNYWIYSAQYLLTDNYDFAVANNYYMRHHAQYDGYDSYFLKYLDELRQWKDIPKIFQITTMRDQFSSVWASNSWIFQSSKIENTPRYDGYALSWNEDYSGANAFMLLNGYSSPAQDGIVTNNSLFTVNMLGSSTNHTGFRFNGNSWTTLFPINISIFNKQFTAGNDYIVRRDNSNGNNVAFQCVYNPNTNTWISSSLLLNGHIPVGNSNSYVYQDKIWNKIQDGSFGVPEILPNCTSLIGTPQPGNGFFAYTALGGNSYVQFLKNGKLGDIEALNNQKVYPRNSTEPYNNCPLVGGNTIITYPYGSDFNNTNQFTLYRAIDENGLQMMITSNRSIPCVAKMTVFDGSNNISTYYDYDGATATTDVNGINPQFNKVTIIPADKANKPYGYTENYFFNQLPCSSLQTTAQYQPNDAFTNAQDNYMLLTGQLYMSKVFKQGEYNTPISISKNFFEVKHFMVNHDFAYLSKVLKTVTSTMGIETRNEMSYNIDNGLISTSKTFCTDLSNIETVQSKNYDYAYLHYPPMFASHMLSQQCSVIGTYGTSTSAQFTTYQNWMPQGSEFWAPHKEYSSYQSVFDFASWSGNNEPPENSGLIKSSEITITDVSTGVFLEAKNIDGKYSSNKRDENSITIANFSNAKWHNVFADNFDDIALNGWSITGSDNLGGWVINQKGELYHGTATAEPLNISPVMFDPDQDFDPNHYQIDYSICMPENNVIDNWGGLIFAKNYWDAPYTESGYLLQMHKNNLTGLASFQLMWKSGSIYQFSSVFNSNKSTADWHQIRITVDNAIIKVFVNGVLGLTVNDNTWRGKSVGFYDYFAKALYDNIMICPATAFSTMIAYNPDNMNTMAKFGADGRAERYIYDQRQNRIATIDHKGIPKNIITSSLSRDRKLQNVYDANDPNLNLATFSRGSFGMYEDFSTHLHDWTELNSANFADPIWELESGNSRGLVHQTSGYTGSGNDVNAFYTQLAQPIAGRVAVEFSAVGFSSDFPNDFTGVGIALGDVSFNPTTPAGSASWAYFKYSGLSGRLSFIIKAGSSLTETIIADWGRQNSEIRVKVVLDFNTKKATYFIDGKPCKTNSEFITSAVENLQRIAFIDYARVVGPCSDSRRRWYLSNLLVYTEPTEAITYSDGVGKVIQNQAEESANSIIVSAPVYDNLGRAHVNTVALRQTGWLGYLPNFVTAFNSSSGLIEGLVNPGSDPNKFPYSRTVFENSPLGRPIEYGQPGAELAIKSGNVHTSKTEYQSNNSHWPFPVPPNSFYETKVTDADGVSVFELKDKFGRKIASQTGPVALTNASGVTYQIFPTTLYEYDTRGDLVSIKTPNYFNDPVTGTQSTTEQHKITMQYDLLHRMIMKTTPEQGTTKFIYDKAGRIRFMMDANGAACTPQRFIYTKYDELKRVSEEGYCYMYNTLTWETIKQYADQPNWPIVQ